MRQPSQLPSLTEQFPPPPWNDAAERIRAFAGASFEDQISIISWCVEHSTPINVAWGKNWRYSRARAFDTLEERPTNVADLIWPPVQHASKGRVNSQGQALMYVGDREGTALAEVNFTEGYAVVSEFSITAQEGVRIIPIGELTSIYRTGRGPFMQEHSDSITGMINASDYEQAQSMLLIDSFLSDVMAMPEVDYRYTAHLASEMFRKIPVATAIAFPSVKRRGGMNVAIKPEGFWNDWSLVGAYYAEYDAPGFAMYKALSRTCVNGVYVDGRLRWAEPDANIQAKLLIDPFKPHPDYPIRDVENGVGNSN